MKYLVVVVALAACGNPQPQLRIDFAGKAPQSCETTKCDEVPLNCDAVMGIRVFDARTTDHDHPLHEQCTLIPRTSGANLCAYRNVTMDAVDLPLEDLEIQVAVYPLSRVAYDETTHIYTCPPPVPYGEATNLPIEQAPTPALGGRAFYHPGDTDVSVVLGCTDLAAINKDPSCVAAEGALITATVSDFTTRQPVENGQTGASLLRVAIGEPRAFDTMYVLNPVDELELHLVKDSAPPSWTAKLEQLFNKYICLDVLEIGPEVTPVIQCTTVEDRPQIDLHGIRLHRNDLNNLLQALNSTGIRSFPEDGLTIGIVLDQASAGAADYVVDTGQQGTVTYLSGPTTFGGSKTSKTGIFVSTDAPFGTRFTTTGARPTRPAIGGKVAGKVTVVILPPAGPP
jgi:hypothetical protein